MIEEDDSIVVLGSVRRGCGGTASNGEDWATKGAGD